MRFKPKRTAAALSAIILLFVAVSQQQGWFKGAQQAAVENQPGLYAIDHFVDGDTITVKMNGRAETVRLIGVDTPETHRPD
ncbi:MAG TPA: hypothetical protein VIR03_01250, partial [Candidatus Saccharimonadales bacterium]